jgi:hypothetical protein
MAARALGDLQSRSPDPQDQAENYAGDPRGVGERLEVNAALPDRAVGGGLETAGMTDLEWLVH